MWYCVHVSDCFCKFLILFFFNCRYKNAQKKRPQLSSSSLSSERIVESGSVINVKSESIKTEDEEEDVVVVVDDVDEPVDPVKTEIEAVETKAIVHQSLSVEEALSKLPPIDYNALVEHEEEGAVPLCDCQLRLVGWRYLI